MFHRSLRTAALPFFAALALAACSGSDESAQSGGSTPEATVMTSAALLKSGDFNRFWKHGLPPADYATLRADWTRRQQAEPPVTADDRARFAAALQQVTGPDAENTLYAMLGPKLTALELQYKDQLPMLISVGNALAKNAVAQSSALGATQKTQIAAAVDVLAPWAQQAPWFDQAKAKQGVGIVVSSARKLALTSPDQVRSMDFDTTMGKYSIGFAGLKQLLANYGLAMDDTLDSVKASQLERSDGHARVKIDYALLGKPLSTEMKLVQLDGRWYSEEMLNNVRQSHQQLVEPASLPTAAPAAAASASAPAGAIGLPPAAASPPVKD